MTTQAANGGGSASPFISPTVSNSPLPNGAPASRSASGTPTTTGQNGVSASSPAVNPGHHPSPPLLQTSFSRPGSQRPAQHTSPPFQDQAGHAASQSLQQKQTSVSRQTQEVPGIRYMSPKTVAKASPAVAIEQTNQYWALAETIRQSAPETVRQAIRDHWEKALVGSQFHVAFLLNATMHQASAETLSRAVGDFGAKLARTSKPALLSHFTAEDYDEVSNILLSRVSNGFLDKALARRLETIPARQLVNALARAERLGYDVRDVIQEKGEHVLPSLYPTDTPAPLPRPYQQQDSHGQAAPSNTAPPPPPAPSQRQFMDTTVTSSGPGTPQALDLPDVRYCTRCGWPCSSGKAVDYHLKAFACGKVLDGDVVGRNVCCHCGRKFVSSGGLSYHVNGNVCGDFGEEKTKQMTAFVEEMQRLGRVERDGVLQVAGAPAARPSASAPARTAAAPATPITGNFYATAPGTAPNQKSTKDPYAKLTSEQRAALEQEMRDIEEYYGTQMKDAMKMPESARAKELAILKNRYNTKQSLTRKKYGVRLRERRTRAEIQAEQQRLMGNVNEGTPGASSGPPAKRARTDGGQPAGTQESPRKLVRVSEMGGLAGSSATAETTDPTAFINSPQPRYVPQQPVPLPQQKMVQSPGTRDDPMSINDSDSGSDSDSDDEDIPATLP